jgi:hypothetical protein
VGALAHYLEAAGIATTQISLIREHTEAINPPRALWVPFMLGRPFGVPNDAAFQERVLLAALRLLEAPSGPVLADYPEDAPAPAPDETQGQACPVSFAASNESDPGEALLREVEALAPWHDLAAERRKRTGVGLSGLSMPEAARTLAAHVNGKSTPCFEGSSLGETLKLVCEDLRTYYYESAAAQPGTPDAAAIEKWFWHDTAAGRVFLAFQAACASSEDKSLQKLAATSIVPRAVMHGLRS